MIQLYSPILYSQQKKVPIIQQTHIRREKPPRTVIQAASVELSGWDPQPSGVRYLPRKADNIPARSHIIRYSIK
jgi:hypothetical protein